VKTSQKIQFDANRINEEELLGMSSEDENEAFLLPVGSIKKDS